MSIELRNYFLVGLGNENMLDNMRADLESISHGDPKYVTSVGIIFVTFESAFKPGEIKNLLSETEGRTFFVYEINNETSAQNFAIPKYYEHLFKEIEEKQVTNVMLPSGATIGIKSMEAPTSTKTQINIPSVDVDAISEEERVKIIDSLIDKGFENLTEEDKELLKKLSQ